MLFVVNRFVAQLHAFCDAQLWYVCGCLYVVMQERSATLASKLCRDRPAGERLDSRIHFQRHLSLALLHKAGCDSHKIPVSRGFLRWTSEILFVRNTVVAECFYHGFGIIAGRNVWMNQEYGQDISLAASHDSVDPKHWGTSPTDSI